MKKFFINRLIIYPFSFSIVWFFVFTRYPDFFILPIIREQINIMTEVIPISLPTSINLILFGLAFGYVYGTISTIIKARQFRGTIFIIVFVGKVLASAMVGVTVGYLIYLLEVLLLPVIIFTFKKFRKKKIPSLYKTKSNNQDDLIREMEKIVYEYKKSQQDM